MSVAPSDRARALIEALHALHAPCSNEERWSIVQRHLDEAEATKARLVLRDAIHLVRTVAVGQDGSRLTLREEIEEQLRVQLTPKTGAVADATGVPVELDEEDW